MMHDVACLRFAARAQSELEAGLDEAAETPLCICEFPSEGMGFRSSNQNFLCRQQRTYRLYHDWHGQEYDIFCNLASAYWINAVLDAIFPILSPSMTVSPASHLPFDVLYSLFLCPLLQGGDLLEEGRLDAVRIVGLAPQLDRENTLVRREMEQATEKGLPRGSEVCLSFSGKAVLVCPYDGLNGVADHSCRPQTGTSRLVLAERSFYYVCSPHMLPRLLLFKFQPSIRGPCRPP
jgi:hypothetical protein